MKKKILFVKDNILNYRKHNIDVPVYIAYFDKDKKTCYLDKPVYINELLSMNLSRFELSKYLCDKCNKLGKYNL
jgi:hypothetical protein